MHNVCYIYVMLVTYCYILVCLGSFTIFYTSNLLYCDMLVFNVFSFQLCCCS